MITERKCSACKESKALDQFPRNAKGSLGLSTQCYACHRLASRLRNMRERGPDYRPRRPRTEATPTTRTEKPCSSCELTKPLEAFRRNRTNPDGREYQCKACHSMQSTVKGLIMLRNLITAPNLLDTFDRGERREELSELGGLCGVRDIRRRIAILRRVKEILCGSTLPLEVIDRLLEVAP
jgi:hypothetical protein